MSNLSDIVNVVIQTQTAGIPKESFSIPLILSPTPFSDAVRSYSDLAGMVTDGFAVTDGAYLAASALFAQTPKPAVIMVGKMASPTMKFRFTPVAANSLAYTLKVDGQTATYTSDSSATIAEITAGMKSAIDALAISGCTTTDNSTSLDIAFTAGQMHSVVMDPTQGVRASGACTIAQTTADVSSAADLAAIALVNNNWYGLLNLFNSKAILDILRPYADANEKLLLACMSDSAIPNTADSGTSDEPEAAQSASSFRTVLFWHEDPKAFLDFAVAGKALPQDTGSEKWSLLNVVGPTPSNLTATQRANLLAKAVTYYRTFGNKNVTYGGKVSSGEWVDVVRGRDGIKSDIQTAVANVLTQDTKTPYTDGGIAAIQGAVLGVLKSYEPDVLVQGSSKCVVPQLSTISTQDKAARVLNNVKADALLSGAILATNIKVTLSL